MRSINRFYQDYQFGNRRCFVSNIFFFITNCHKLTYSCLLEFLISKEKREGNVIFSAFVSLKDPFPPKNSLSQRSRLLRIQHWDVIFTYKQNKHLAATDFGRIWVGDVTSLLEARLDHKGESSYLFINMWLYDRDMSSQLQSGGISFILACPKKCDHHSVNSLYLAVKKDNNCLIYSREFWWRSLGKFENFTEPATRLPA